MKEIMLQHTIIQKNRGESHSPKMSHMKSQQRKPHYLVMSFLTPETYPNYQLSHHPFSFPLTGK